MAPSQSRVDCQREIGDDLHDGLDAGIDPEAERASDPTLAAGAGEGARGAARVAARQQPGTSLPHRAGAGPAPVARRARHRAPQCDPQQCWNRRFPGAEAPVRVAERSGGGSPKWRSRGRRLEPSGEGIRPVAEAMRADFAFVAPTARLCDDTRGCRRSGSHDPPRAPFAVSGQGPVTAGGEAEGAQGACFRREGADVAIITWGRVEAGHGSGHRPRDRLAVPRRQLGRRPRR